MNRTKIEWTDYTWNPLKGRCPMGCEYCYAKAIYDRFKWNPEIRMDYKELNAPCRLRKPSRIFTGSMIELFGEWNDYGWMGLILATVKRCPQHTFQFLTKQPEIMAQFDFPENCWLGVSVDYANHWGRIYDLKRNNDNVLYVSFEPLMEDINPLIHTLEGIDWIILGGLSGERNKENIRQRQEWAETIIDKARYLNIPVFVKDNLKFTKKIQEFPKKHKAKCF
jgi:protein gp37